MPLSRAFCIPNVQAILFDMDGTLVDSSDSVARAWRRWARRRKLEEDTVVRVCQGRPARDTIRLLAPAANIDEEYDFVLAEELRDAAGTVAVPGAAALLHSLQVQNVRWAIVTSAAHALACHRLQLAQLSIPTHLVTVESVQRGKPDPEGYLLGAKRLAVSPENCLVIEDSPIGIAAGRAAGMRVLGIGDTFARAELETEIAIEDFQNVVWTDYKLLRR